MIVFLILNYKTYLDTIRIVNDLLPDLKENRIVVVDNNSGNESYRILTEKFSSNPSIDIILSKENGGYAKGNNFGLRYMDKYSPDYVCIMNNDIYFDYQMIDRLERIMSEIEDCAILSPIQYLKTGKQVRFGNLFYPSWWFDVSSYLFTKIKRVHRYYNNCGIKNLQKVYTVPGAFLFADYKKLKQVGFYNEITFLYCEERFLGDRLYDAGFSSYIVLDEKYVHEHSKTISAEQNSEKIISMIFESRWLYSTFSRKDNWLKKIILYFSFCFFKLQLKVMSVIRRVL